MSRSPTAGQTALESTLKSPAVPPGPRWLRSRGHKNNPPRWLVYTQRHAYFPELSLHSTNRLFFGRWLSCRHTDSFPVKVIWEELKVNCAYCTSVPHKKQHLRKSALFSLILAVLGLWSQTEEASASGDTCAIFLSKDIFHDRWVARSIVLTVPQLHFILSTGSVCLCVWKDSGVLHMSVGRGVLVFMHLEWNSLHMP